MEDAFSASLLSATTLALSNASQTSADNSILRLRREVEHAFLVCQALLSILLKDTVLQYTASATIYRPATAGPVQEVQL